MVFVSTLLRRVLAGIARVPNTHVVKSRCIYIRVESVVRNALTRGARAWQVKTICLTQLAYMLLALKRFFCLIYSKHVSNDLYGEIKHRQKGTVAFGKLIRIFILMLIISVNSSLLFRRKNLHPQRQYILWLPILHPPMECAHKWFTETHYLDNKLDHTWRESFTHWVYAGVRFPFFFSLGLLHSTIPPI